MKIIKALALSIFAFQFSTPVEAQVSPQFMPLADSFEVSNPNAVQAINIHYDKIEPERQLFHLFLPNTEGSFPLVVFIHGGGFTGGSPGSVFKDPKRRADVKYFLDRGFAYASFGYRVISESGPDSEGVIKSLSDAKRALQFVRHYANDLHIESDRIALMGTSAGAGTSLWLATRTDMADVTSSDPVLRESTRVAAVVAGGSQSTYDIFKWETEVYDDFDGQGTNFTLDSIAEIMTAERLENFYGEQLDSLYQLVHDPALIQYRQDVDMLSQLSADDPPLYISSQSGAMHPSDDVLHHSLHGKEIYETAMAANVSEIKADIPSQSILTTNGESANEFLFRHLSGEASVPEVPLSVGAAPQFQLAPNPATNYFSVAVSDAKIRNVQVLSLSGTILMADENLTDSSQISTSSLSSGVYVVKIVAMDGSTAMRRLIVE